jgi:hypothetical protein
MSASIFTTLLRAPPSAPPAIPTATPVRTSSVTTGSPKPSDTLSTTVWGTNALDGSPRSETQKKLDAFKDRYTPEYTVDGQQVQSATPFRMVGGDNQGASEKEMKAADASGEIKGPSSGVAFERIKKDLIAAKKWDKSIEGPAHRVTVGRGTPEDVKKVTQALIDAGKLPNESETSFTGTVTHRKPEERIREMQWRYGIGVDCAGYCAQASPASKGKSAADAGTDKVVYPPYGLLMPSASPAYSRMKPPLAPDGAINAKPGDIVALSDPDPEQPGHFVTVYDNKRMSGADLDKFKAPTQGNRFWNGADGKPAKNIVVMQTDSSWGASGNPQAGGVERHTWLYNPETKTWAGYDPATKLITPETVGPYGHTVSAVYRAK